MTEFPEAWRPQPGDTICGPIVKIATAHGWQDRPYPIITLRTATLDREQDIAVHAFHEVLRNELAARSPQVGDVLTITFLGKHPNGYHGYRVIGSERPFDWSQFGGTVPAQANPNEITDAMRDLEACAADNDLDDIPY